MQNQKASVDSGRWLWYRYHPDLVKQVDTPRSKRTGILGSMKPLKLDSLQSLTQRWDSPQALIWVCPTLFAFAIPV
ncbi:hypothetical protein [Anabaena sp. CCY 9402-a]|uniref:hypothetical protein n=1 Tax=Anabaena sp. CCY 9402-a TaxID=3103867 RepID=UPI0039C676BF